MFPEHYFNAPSSMAPHIASNNAVDPLLLGIFAGIVIGLLVYLYFQRQ